VSYLETRSSTLANGSDLVLTLRPSLAYASQSGRVRGSGAYSLGLSRRSKSELGSETQNDLRAQFTAEAVPNWFYIDATAAAGRTSLSAFGQQSADGSQQGNSNRTDVGSLSLSPYVRGALGSWATYEARYLARATNTRHSKEGDSTSTLGQVSISSASQGTVIGWGLSASRDHASFRTARGIDNERVVASLSVMPVYDWRLTLRGGQESTNAIDTERLRYDNWGAGLQWTPNQRTQVSLNTDRRYFGSSHQVSISHRLPLSTIIYSGSKAVSTTSDPNAGGQTVTLYELYFLLYASAVPDPVAREQFVLTLLQSLGLNPGALATGGFINRTVTLQRRSDLAWTYAGRRVTLTIQGNVTHSDPLEGSDFQLEEGSIAQKGYTTTLGYRLTPTSSVNLIGQRLMTRPTLSRSGTDLKSLALNWTDQIGRRASATLGARYSVFNSQTDPYRESALTASLNIRF
jgi:uncharacterized protein (PEP-CTERM system associated)